MTSSCRFPKKIKAFLQNSDAEHRVITNRTLKRLGLWKGVEGFRLLDQVYPNKKLDSPILLEGLEFTSSCHFIFLEKLNLPSGLIVNQGAQFT